MSVVASDRFARRRRIVRSAAWVAAILSGTCGCSAYYAGSSYEPKPADVAVNSPALPAANAHTLVSVIGVRKKDKAAAMPPCVEIRIRLENDGAVPITFDGSSLRLLAANLEAFPPAVVAPPARLVVAPDGAGTVTAYFPFSDGNVPGPFDLSGLNLRWEVEIGGRAVTANATFRRRRDKRYYDRDPYYPFGGYPGYWWRGYPDHDRGNRPHKPKVLDQKTVQPTDG